MSKRVAQTKDRGAVLLTTLLIMTIMATIAVLILEQTRIAISRSANTQVAAQADWYVTASESFVESLLTDWMGNSDKALKDFLKTPQITALPIQGGQMSFLIRDGSTCIALADLDKEPARRALQYLILNVTGDPLRGPELAAAIADWQDADTEPLSGGAEDYDYMSLNPPYRTSNVTITNLPELRAIKYMDERLYQALLPFLCTGAGRKTTVNVNTMGPLQAPVLAAVLGKDMEDVAARIIRDRPPEGYTNQTLMTSPAISDADLSEIYKAAITYEPSFVWIEATVDLGPIKRYAAYEFDVAEGQPKRTYRAYSSEDFRRFKLDDKRLETALPSEGK